MNAVKWKVVLIMMVSVLAVSLGETLLAKGMRSTDGLPNWAAQVKAALASPYVLGGTLLMMVYFGLYMAALSMADLSFVLPLTAVSYLLGALLAKFYLHENVTPMKWLGTFVIVIGVIIVGIGEAGSRQP